MSRLWLAPMCATKGLTESSKKVGRDDLIAAAVAKVIKESATFHDILGGVAALSKLDLSRKEVIKFKAGAAVRAAADAESANLAGKTLARRLVQDWVQKYGQTSSKVGSAAGKLPDAAAGAVGCESCGKAGKRSGGNSPERPQHAKRTKTSTATTL